jgi:hypothetical protein
MWDEWWDVLLRVFNVAGGFTQGIIRGVGRRQAGEIALYPFVFESV